MSEQDDLLATLLHDLRNPLSAIVMNATHLLRTWPAEDARPHARRQMSLIVDEAARATRLMQDLADAVSLDDGTLVVAPKPHAIGELFDEARELLRPALERKRVSLGWPSFEALAPVACDRAQIVRVLFYWLEHAHRLAADDTSLTVTAKPLAGQLRVTVGQEGIDDCPSGDDLAGRGIALYAARRILKANGGHMSAQAGDREWFLSLVLPVSVITDR